MKNTLSLCLLFYVLASSSCEKSVSGPNEDIVAWPEITRFDDLALGRWTSPSGGPCSLFVIC